jgi:DNA primase
MSERATARFQLDRGEPVTLRYVGRTWIGDCPIRGCVGTLAVNANRGSYHCFGCGEQGAAMALQ